MYIVEALFKIGIRVNNNAFIKKLNVSQQAITITS